MSKSSLLKFAPTDESENEASMYRCGPEVSNEAIFRSSVHAWSSRIRGGIGLIGAGMVGAGILLATTPVMACSCQEPPDVQTALEQSARVFEGRVVSASTDGPTHRVTFEVVQRWKGGAEETLQFEIDTMCGYVFEAGSSYLVYSDHIGEPNESGTPRQESVSLCSRTSRIQAATADLAVLGAGSTPVNPASGSGSTPLPRAELEPQQGGSAGCSAGGLHGPRIWIGWLFVLLCVGARTRRVRVSA